MYCVKCGKQISEGSSFCGYCGVNQNVNPYSATIKSRQTGSVYNGTSLYRRKRWPWILVIAAVVAVTIIIATSSGGGGGTLNRPTADPNITVEQMKRDLVDNDVYIVTAWWESLYHLKFKEFKFSKFEITKTLTEDKTVYYYVNISGESYASIDAPFIITYKKFNEGWAYASIKYTGSI